MTATATRPARFVRVPGTLAVIWRERIKCQRGYAETYTAWIPNPGPGSIAGGCSCFTSLNDEDRAEAGLPADAPKWWGRVGTDILPPSIDALPAGPARIRAVEAFLRGKEQKAYALIRKAFPSLAGTERSGEITCHSDD